MSQITSLERMTSLTVVFPNQGKCSFKHQVIFRLKSLHSICYRQTQGKRQWRHSGNIALLIRINTHPLSQLTGTAKIDDFDRRPFRVAQQNVLGLQIAMNYTKFGRGQEQQRRAQLLRELSCQIERHAPKIGIAQQIVQVVRQQFEHEAQMISPHEMSF